jgi:hypothetical protein
MHNPLSQTLALLAVLTSAVPALAGPAPRAAAESRAAIRTADVEILVDGTPRPRYAHDGRWYVEALKGREYSIRLRNPYPVRVAVALSVDGLNTIDARETSAGAARKWVLGPYETVVIGGWQTSRQEARRFEFTTEERSYGQALGRTKNLGVIAAVFFKERTPEVRELHRESRLRDDRQSSEAPDAASGAAAGSTRPSAAPAPAPSQAAAERAAAKAADNEYAATGMGRRTDHAVQQVWLDLEDTPAASMDIRYEFRPQLVRLGILHAPAPVDRLTRRERARGFEPGFAPDPEARR